MRLSDKASPAGPVAPSDRIAAIDSARGIALFGVMAINVATVFRVSIFEQFLPDRGDGTALDRALYWILMVGVDLKAFALFSLLFGVALPSSTIICRRSPAARHCSCGAWRS